MRAIRSGLLTAVLLAAASSPARADVIDFHGAPLFNGGANTFSGGCGFGLCGANAFSLEFDTKTHGGSDIAPGTFDGVDSVLNKTVALTPSPSFEIDLKVFNAEPHSVPEPGTLLLMGLGIVAAGMLQRRRIQPVR